jgi:nucleoside-triphosphatase THEP1
MAKALLGHVGGADLRLVDEVRRLRTRVRELEAELARVSAANDALVASVHVEDDIRLLTLDDQPALT